MLLLPVLYLPTNPTRTPLQVSYVILVFTCSALSELECRDLGFLEAHCLACHCGVLWVFSPNKRVAAE